MRLNLEYLYLDLSAGSEYSLTELLTHSPSLTLTLTLLAPCTISPSFLRRYFSFLEKCTDAKACTVLLRGGSKDVLNEIERNLSVRTTHHKYYGLTKIRKWKSKRPTCAQQTTHTHLLGAHLLPCISISFSSRLSTHPLQFSFPQLTKILNIYVSTTCLPPF